MTKHQSKLVLYFILIVTAGCAGKADVPEADYRVINNPEWGSMQDYDTPPFRFELIDSILIETPNDKIVAGIRSLLTDKDGNIYFFDQQQSKLISISSDGNFRWMTGQKGKGPGDFENVYSMVSDSDQLYIGNIQGSRIDRYDFNGNFLSSKNMGDKLSFGRLQGFLKSGPLVISTPNFESWGHTISIVNFDEDSLEVLNTFNIDQAGDVETLSGLTTSSTLTFHNDFIYTGSIQDYSFEVYNQEGKLQKRVQRDYDKIVRPGIRKAGSGSSIRLYGSVYSPVFLPNEYSIVFAAWPTNVSDPDQFMNKQNPPEVKYRNSLDIFSPDDKLLYSFETESYQPEIRSIQHIDDAGFIYTTKSEPEPIIYKYQLQVNPEYQHKISF